MSAFLSNFMSLCWDSFTWFLSCPISYVVLVSISFVAIIYSFKRMIFSNY